MDKDLMNHVQKLNFFIKEPYKPRLNPAYFFDQPGNVIWQPRVYSFASHLGDFLGCSTVIDIGCGNAFKLANLYPKYRIIGIDIGENLTYCRTNYPFGTWIDHDLEQTSYIIISDKVVQSSVIICADVIEHLVNPSYLLWNIKKLLQLAPLCILTTPERDLTYKAKQTGPPKNYSHVREWNMEEFIDLLRAFELYILYSGLTVSNSKNAKKETIFVILGNNDQKHVHNKRLLKLINRLELTDLI